MKIKNKIKTCIAITFAALLFGCSGEPKIDTMNGYQGVEKSKKAIIASLKNNPKKLDEFLGAWGHLRPNEVAKKYNGMNADQLIETSNKLTREYNEKNNKILKKIRKENKESREKYNSSKYKNIKL